VEVGITPPKRGGKPSNARWKGTNQVDPHPPRPKKKKGKNVKGRKPPRSYTRNNTTIVKSHKNQKKSGKPISTEVATNNGKNKRGAVSGQGSKPHGGCGK